MGALQKMFEDLGIEDVDEGLVIPIPNVAGRILRKLLTWASYHKDDVRPAVHPIYDYDYVEMTPWDKEFLSLDIFTLTDLLTAAHSLEVKDLLSFTGKMVAYRLVRMPLTQIAGVIRPGNVD